MRNLVTPLLLFVLCLVIYNLNFITIGAGDTTPAKLLPFNILMGEGIYFDKFNYFMQQNHPEINQYFFTNFDKHSISAYPIIGGFLVIPIYLPVFIYLMLTNSITLEQMYNLAYYLEKIGASVLAGLSVVIFYYLMKNLSKNKAVSLLFSVVFASATQNFSISSQALWQHTSANLFLVISLLFFLKGLPGKDISKIYLSLMFGVLATWARLNLIPYLAVLNIILTLVNRRNVFAYLGISSLGLLILLGHNYFFYHSLIGGYEILMAEKAQSNFVEGFLGLLFSPARGVLFYTPFFFLAFFSVLIFSKLKDSNQRLFFSLNYVYFIATILINSFWGSWWGGHSWGNRLLTDIAIPAVLLSYIFYTNTRNQILKLVFIILVLYSVFTQSLGVFVSRYIDWNNSPTNVDYDTKRLWDFSDSPITRSLKYLL